MNNTDNSLSISEAEASWHRQRSDAELLNFIDQKHSSLDIDFDLALSGSF